jgi:hypothetical protein
MQGFVSTFVLALAALGSLVGAMVGYTLDGVTSSRLIAVISAVASVAVLHAVRGKLSKWAPMFFMPLPTKMPAALWVGICYATLVGALADDDITSFFNLQLGALIGCVSGALANLSTAMLIFTYFHTHPEAGVEF